MQEESANLPQTADFGDLRRMIFGIAYRMLGSVADAEDIVQESILRMHTARTAGTAIESEKAYVAAIATRLAIDQLRRRQSRREEYVGEWLPEPVVEEAEPAAARHAEIAESLSMAFLLVLETLSPVERAVFLLREVFDYEYQEIATIVGKSEDNCRQLFARARRHVDEGRPRFEASAEKREQLAQRFFAACETGDLEGLVNLLAADAAFHGDGGGKATAILQPVTGREKVAQMLHGFLKKGWAMHVHIRPMTVNGQPGALLLDAQDRAVSVIALDIADGAIRAIRSVVNPDKLRHLGPVSDLAVLHTVMSQKGRERGLNQ